MIELIGSGSVVIARGMAYHSTTCSMRLDHTRLTSSKVVACSHVVTRMLPPFSEEHAATVTGPRIDEDCNVS
eukprot:COSAG05_NODE_13000_length_445_cov_1.002890_1_plen_71_part_10